ncbi:transcription elongation factor [Lotmaria passim]
MADSQASPGSEEGTAKAALVTDVPATTHHGNAPSPKEESKPSSSSVGHTLKRPRPTEPVTHLLHPASSPAGSASASSSSLTDTVQGSAMAAEAVAVPPKQARTEGSGSPVTPRSPYANLPRKVPRKTPTSTPASAAGTPTLVSPAQASPALSSPASTTTSPQSLSPVSAVVAKMSPLHRRWANLLHPALMQDREPHEAEAVMALCARIIAALPGDLEETADGFQTILFSMRDKKNGELRRKLVEGELLVERLVRMDDRELANPELRKKIEDKMEDRAKDTNLSELAKAMRTSNSTLFKCKTCGARDTSWYQRQTRSGDEPMTVIITCNKCNTQWRQY